MELDDTGGMAADAAAALARGQVLTDAERWLDATRDSGNVADMRAMLIAADASAQYLARLARATGCDRERMNDALADGALTAARVGRWDRMDAVAWLLAVELLDCLAESGQLDGWVEQ